jgi:uncharacterized protein (DUF58 family)
MLIPTPRLWWLVGAGIPLALGGAFVPGLESLVLPWNVALLVLFFVTGQIAKKWDLVEVDRRMDPVLSARAANSIRLRVRNLADQTIRIRLKDDPPPLVVADHPEWNLTLRPGEERDLRYSVTPLRRGQERFGGVFIRYQAPLGLCEVQQLLPVQEEVRVYPNVLALQEYDLLKQKGHLNQIGVRRSRIRGLGQEFESLRDYADDDMRMVDWKATARRGRLVVKQFQEERNQAVFLCIDVGRTMLGEVEGVPKLDYALDAALMLMHAAKDKGDQVGMMVFNDAVHSLSLPRKGRAQIASILERIHDVRAEAVQSDYLAAIAFLRARWKKRSLVVIFTDAEDPDAARELAAAVSQLRRQHLVFVVRVDDPKMKELEVYIPTNRYEMYRRAATHWYRSERNQASNILASSGVQNIDSEPQDLSAALVTAYLVVKERALI